MDDETEVTLANRLLEPMVGQQLIQFKMGTALWLVFDHFEVMIETVLFVENGGMRWSGKPLTTGAADALLPLNLQRVTSVRVDDDASLHIGIGDAAISVPPDPLWEAWQIDGPDEMLIIGLGHGEVAI